MAPSVLLMLALAAPAASIPHNFSTDERPSTALLLDAGTASVRSVIRNVGAGQLDAAGIASVMAVASGSHDAFAEMRQLDAAGLASVQAAANVQRTAAMGTAQLSAVGLASVQAAANSQRTALVGTARLTNAGLASVQAAAKNPSAQARGNGGIVQAGGIAPRASGVSFANGTATPVSMRMPAGMAAPTSNPDTPSTTAPATGAAPRTPGTDTLSEAGRIAVDASVAALRAAAVAMRARSGTAPAGLAAAGDPDAHYARGVQALQAKDSQTAIAELSACVQAAPTRADCRWELGWAYSVDGRWADSLTQWTQVRTLKPDQPDLESALTQARNQAALQARLAQPV
ncbi:hypothetical protein D7V93_43305, partial [Corallococcus llansteffanensis]